METTNEARPPAPEGPDGPDQNDEPEAVGAPDEPAATSGPEVPGATDPGDAPVSSGGASMFARPTSPAPDRDDPAGDVRPSAAAAPDAEPTDAVAVGDDPYGPADAGSAEADTGDDPSGAAEPVGPSGAAEHPVVDAVPAAPVAADGPSEDPGSDLGPQAVGAPGDSGVAPSTAESGLPDRADGAGTAVPVMDPPTSVEAPTPRATTVDRNESPPPTAPPAAEPRRRSMAPRILMGLGILVVLSVLVFAALVVKSRSGPGPDPALAEAQAFVKAWTAGDVVAMQALVDAPTAPAAPVSVAADLEAALSALPVTNTVVTLVNLGLVEGDRRVANVNIELTSPELPPIAYAHSIPFRKIDDDNWRVSWSRSVIHPALTADARFDRVSNWAPRANLVMADGQPLATVAGEVRIEVRPADVVDRPGLEAALASALGIDAATVEKGFTAARATGQGLIKTVTRSQFEAARKTIYDVKGLRFPTPPVASGIGGSAEQVIAGTVGPASAEQAAALGAPYKQGDIIGQNGLQASQQKTLGGLPSTEVRIVNGAGAVVQPIVTVDGSPPKPVVTTIDIRLQRIADALARETMGVNGGGIVVIDRTGAIRAMANPSTFNWAAAQYPPGSTMKVVTAAALLNHGLTPDTNLSCPVEIESAGQKYGNFEDESEASLSFGRAFAISCNTAFLGATKALSGDEMRAATSAFGFNIDYDIGIPMAVRGSFPNDGDGAAKSSMAIGQGRVLTNPVHMASVAAAVMTGQWRAPSLLAERPPSLPTAPPLDPRVRDQLEGMMKGVVDFGSGTAAKAPGRQVFGKTGTAEIGPGTGKHLETDAWFVGYSGDLAIGIVVHKGGVGGRVAAPIAGRFFAQV